MLTSCWLKSVNSYFFTNLSTDKPCYKFIRVYKLCISKLIRIINFQTDHNTIRPIRAIRAIRRRLKQIGMENFIEAMPTWNKLEHVWWFLLDVGLALAAKKMCQFFCSGMCQMCILFWNKNAANWPVGRHGCISALKFEGLHNAKPCQAAQHDRFTPSNSWV